jgi:hypothetical protein
MFDMIFWVVVSGVCYFAYKLDQSLNASSSSHQVKISSPTLLVDNDIVIFGGETDSSDGACTTSLPDKEDLRNLLNGLT